MIGDKRTYTLSEKVWRRSCGLTMWRGSIFLDHGRTMQIVEVGQRYKYRNQWLIDIEAEEVEKNKKGSTVWGR
jgi:hypothetical protein